MNPCLAIALALTACAPQPRLNDVAYRTGGLHPSGAVIHWADDAPGIYHDAEPHDGKVRTWRSVLNSGQQAFLEVR